MSLFWVKLAIRPREARQTVLDAANHAVVYSHHRAVWFCGKDVRMAVFYHTRDLSMVVEAIQFIHGNIDEIEAFVGSDTEWRNRQLIVPTPRGALTMFYGDWIVKRTDDSFLAIAPDVFKLRYHPPREL